MTDQEHSRATARRSLRTKLVRLMVVSITVASVATLATVSWMNIRTSRDHLAAIERQLGEAIEAKGKVLTENQALALKGMVSDNAFGDVDRMIRRVVAQDPDVVYGLFVSTDGRPWAYYAPDHPATTGDAPAADPKTADLGGWKKLGVVPPSPTATTVRTTSQHKFDQDVIELAMPVRDGNDVLGAIYYGLSTRSLAQARELAREQARSALIDTLAILGGVAVGIALFFLVLAMRQAKRITRPLGELTVAASAFASGRRDARVNITSGDELEQLGGAFNQMVRDLDQSYSQLEDMNKNLEARVEQRTAELASRNRDMRLVLDNVEQGFITVDLNGVMAMERSAVVDKWLGTYALGTKFGSFVAQHDDAFAAVFELGIDAIREDWMPLEVSLDQLPRNLRVGARELRFAYSPVFDSGKLSALLVVAADVTERIARERSELEQREAMAVFESVMRDRRGFLAFFTEADHLVGAITAGASDADLPTFKRLVHTLKGNAAIFKLTRVAELCHDIESSIEEDDGAPRPELRDALARRWRALVDQVHMVIGDRKSLTVSTADHDALVKELSAAGASRTVVRKIAAWRLERAHDSMTRLGDKARAIADRLGKPGLEVDVACGDLMLDPRKWDRFWSELVHVIRNSVDHGIEEPEAREAKGKPPAGALAFRAEVENGQFIVSLADDGQGIHWAAVEAKARARGLPADTRQDLEKALFSSGFSTRDEVTTTSGRGVGLDAVYQSVQALDGRIEMESTPGHGTVFRFVFPEEAMAGSFYRELETRLSSLDYTATIRRKGDSLTSFATRAPADPH
jgi:HAMP domain-containing protein/HPt (histidine-containing phosphotransfer) domain-containing protein